MSDCKKNPEDVSPDKCFDPDMVRDEKLKYTVEAVSHS